MRSQAVRTVLFAVLAVGVGGAVGRLWTGNPISAAIWINGEKCVPNLNCGNVTVSGSGFCQTGADCQGTNDGATFSACITSDPDRCHAIGGGATKGCAGVCQDAGRGACSFTLNNC